MTQIPVLALPNFQEPFVIVGTATLHRGEQHLLSSPLPLPCSKVEEKP